MKFFGNSVTQRWIRSLQICVHSRLTALVADVMAHAGGARREDREVGAALLLQPDLVLLQALADLVVAHLQAGARRQRGLVLHGLGLVLAEAVQVLGLGGVVAVAIDDHEVLAADGVENAADATARATNVKYALRSIVGAGALLIYGPPQREEGKRMADLPRLNGVIRALEAGQPAFTCFSPAEIDSAYRDQRRRNTTASCSRWSTIRGTAARCATALQYMLNRAQIVKSGSLAPAVTPMVRVPVNGVEKGQWHAKQALDIGCYGIVWPHISTVEEAYNAVAACRYPRLKSAKNYEPAGIRGDGPTGAVRYWGLTQQEYYDKADVWPLDPNGEIFVILQIEDMRGRREPRQDADRR